MIGKTISHYKIIEKLGSGSMGTVYKAEDTKLKRIVALKFLPPHLVSGEIEKKRFLHEAQAASALNHPNIITIYDIHDELDKVFIVMECCDGQMLTDKLNDGPLKQKELLNIGIGITEGLNAAHNADITHRDIKSQNIIISDDCPPKIIDFGIAKQVGMTDITKDGTTLGTQCYMSPEQLHGSKVDKRSDIFSFGVVLYEMATGKLPFSGKHDAEILYSVVNEEPIPITTLNPNMDDELQRIVDKALKKNVKDRYQHVDEMLADLRNLKKKKPPKKTKDHKWWRIPTYVTSALIMAVLVYMVFLKNDNSTFEHSLGKKSIAVLPFTTIDRTEESEIFSEGIHDDILTQIAKIHDLKVIARTSVMQYRDTKKGIKEIAKELNVTSILEGSVRRLGNQIRIVAQLIDSETEEHIWAENYDRAYADIFSIQSEVAQDIALSLKTSLSPNEIYNIGEVPTQNTEAYENYLKGKIILTKDWSLKSEKQSIPFFEKAIALDQRFLQAYVMLCRAHLGIYWDNEQTTPENLNSAKHALDEAKNINPRHSDVFLADGYYHYYGFRDYQNALKSFYIAIKDHPNDSELLSAIGHVKRRQGKWNEALNYLIKASDTDPNDYRKTITTGDVAQTLRDWDLADKYYSRAILINPNSQIAYEWKFYLAYSKGDLHEVQMSMKEALKYFEPHKLFSKRKFLEYLNRDYEKAYMISQEYEMKEGDSPFKIMSNLRDKGRYSKLMGNLSLSNAYFDSLLILAQQKINKNSDRLSNHFWIAEAYALKGMKNETLKEISIIKKMMPIELDAETGAAYKNGIADLYLKIGDFEKAIDEYEYLLSIPGPISIGQIKLTPAFDPIRDNPRFQEVLKKYDG